MKSFSSLASYFSSIKSLQSSKKEKKNIGIRIVCRWLRRLPVWCCPTKKLATPRPPWAGAGKAARASAKTLPGLSPQYGLWRQAAKLGGGVVRASFFFGRCPQRGTTVFIRGDLLAVACRTAWSPKRPVCARSSRHASRVVRWCFEEGRRSRGSWVLQGVRAVGLHRALKFEEVAKYKVYFMYYV